MVSSTQLKALFILFCLSFGQDLSGTSSPAAYDPLARYIFTSNNLNGDGKIVDVSSHNNNPFGTFSFVVSCFGLQSNGAVSFFAEPATITQTLDEFGVSVWMKKITQNISSPLVIYDTKTYMKTYQMQFNQGKFKFNSNEGNYVGDTDAILGNFYYRKLDICGVLLETHHCLDVEHYVSIIPHYNFIWFF